MPHRLVKKVFQKYGDWSAKAEANWNAQSGQAWERLRQFSSIAAWNSQVRHLRARMRRIGRLMASRHYGQPDDFFFSFDELPAMGKEYWFLHFVEPGTRRQVVLTFGRAVSSVKVNATGVPAPASSARAPSRAAGLLAAPARLEAQAMAASSRAGALLRHPRPLSPGQPLSMPCAAVCWLYGAKKEVLIDSSARVRIDGQGRLRSLTAASGKSSVLIEGTYPNYSARLVHNGRAVFSARITPSAATPPYEFIHLLRSPILKGFGADMVNYYFKFRGTLQGRPAAGTAYLQKVLAVLPLAPWNWVRIQFASGAVLDFFTAKPLGPGPQSFQMASNDYFEFNGRRHRLGGLTLHSWGFGERRRWTLAGPKLYLSMGSYALQPFAMKTKTRFQYDEYLVQVSDFILQTDGQTFTLDDTGQGSGIVEEASGYLL
ncbi:MAG: hypothetical protein KGH63_00520 [Candidatus Micrarchaeota archaeon]|nr:hypothetical protein [Candidatus Micrarchaeota archaeon]